MNFLLMCCFDESRWMNLPEAQRADVMDRYRELIQDLKKNGKLLAGAKLDDSANAVTVRERKGQPVGVDGPFAETKEQLGGYHLVECKDRDEAIAIASRIPTLPVGRSIEVRQVLETE